MDLFFIVYRVPSVIPSQSNFGPKRVFKDDLMDIHDEGYDNRKYKLKKMPFKKLMNISMVWVRREIIIFKD